MKTFFLLSTFLLSLSCATGEKFSGVREGMSKAEVESRIGAPDDVKQFPYVTLYRYVNRFVSGWSFDKADYFVIFGPDSLVKEYGRENYQAHRPAYKPVNVNSDSSDDNASRGVTCESSSFMGNIRTDCKPK